MTLFRLDASIMPATSASRALGDIVEQEWTSAHPDSTVLRRDLAADPVPATAWQNAVMGGFTPEDSRSDEQREALALAATLADELVNADALLFNVPLYNFGVSQHFKVWFDLVKTDPRLAGAVTEINGKPATLVTVLGGNYSEGTPKEGWDHSTDWLVRVLQDVWGLNLRVVTRPFTLVGVDPALNDFTDIAAGLKSDAEQTAHKSGREIAEIHASSNAA